MHKIIATGSKGNAVLYHNSILVDCGVSFSLIEPYLYDLQIVLLSHVHGDHININTLDRIAFERPSLRIGCCEWMANKMHEYKNVDVYNVGRWYDYGAFEISPIKLYHDVENCGYRIIKNDYKIIHATDTSHLNGIEAKDYDLFAIEHNYNADTVDESIARIEARGQFAYQKGAMNTHLSEQQAREFIYNNRKPSSEVIRLHESNTN